MNEPTRYPPNPPVGSFILIGLMYLPWLWAVLPPYGKPGENEGWEFPGSLIAAFFALVYVVVAITLSIRLGRRRSASTAHAIAFYASLGILVLIGISIARDS